MVRSRLPLFAVVALVASVLPAFAHPGHDAIGLVAGVLHPLSGLDHILAMVAVGLWAGSVGGRALLAWPLAFVSFVAVGALLGAAGLEAPMIETWIALTVVCLGGVIALGLRASVGAGAWLCASFALLHGIAHGLEMPRDASGLAYGLGFIASTLALHGLGIALAIGARRVAPMRLMRIVGAGVALAGTGLLLG
jgi:urease accessory protein